MPAEVQDLQRYAIAFVVIGVVLTVGLAVLGGVHDSLTLTESIMDESHQPATPLPSNFTVDKASESTYVQVVAGSETVVFYDDSAGTNTTLTDGSDYVAYYEDGNFEVQNTSVTTDYDSAADKFFIDYDAEMEDTEARSGASNAMSGLETFTDWLPLIALVVVAAIVVGLVSVFRGRGRGGTRGRA